MKKCNWCDENYNELEADRNRLADNLQYQWDSSRFCCLECCQLSWQVDQSGSNPFLEGPVPDGQQLCRNSRRMENVEWQNSAHERMPSIFRWLKEIKDFIERETIIQPNIYMFIHSRILKLYSELEHINIFFKDINRRSNEVNKI